MSMRHKSIMLLSYFLAETPLAIAQLKDPYLRDDDISGATFTSDVSINSNGHYVYTYNLDAPESNTGSILYVSVDISCPDTPDPLGFLASDYPSDTSPSVSDNNHHVPVAIDAPLGQSGVFGISASNAVSWGMIGGDPGGQTQGLTIISPYPPGDREYKLVPTPTYKQDEWDYESVYGTDVSGLPGPDDWTVTGITTGPACPGNEYPDDGDPGDGDDSGDDDGGDTGVFAGSLFFEHSQAMNMLLTYSEPLQNQFHLPPGSTEFTLKIHYSDELDPKSFKVTPNKQGIQRLFHPEPGTSETVTVPLKAGKNRIELQAQSRFEKPKGKEKETPPGRRGLELDKDVFVVRVDEADPNGKGKGKTK